MVNYHGQVETPHCMKLVIVNVDIKLTRMMWTCFYSVCCVLEGVACQHRNT
jgi:hypothetical protein